MAGFNKVILMGNLTRNPELRYTPSRTPVASFGLAVSRRFKQGEELKEEVCFVDIVVFGKQAEHCGQYLSKGNGAIIVGLGCSFQFRAPYPGPLIHIVPRKISVWQ